MSTIKITAKRQATFPVAVCRELGVSPGDELSVEKRLVDGKNVWVLAPPARSLSWIGAAKKYAIGKSHDMADIRKSIGRGLAKEKGL